MTTLTHRVGRTALCGLVAAAAVFTAAQSFAVPSYDGNWSVLVMTQKGTCDAAYRYPVRISNGQLANAGDNPFSISGAVAPTGSITVTVSAGGKSASGSGKLAGDAGGGLWSGGSCSGTWTAERRGT